MTKIERAAYLKKWKLDHPAAVKQHSRNQHTSIKGKISRNAWFKKRKQRNQQWLKNYKKTLCCSRCLENCPACLQFHHTGSNKIKNVSAMITSTLKCIQAEIAKCIVLCANCHAKEHWRGL